MFSNLLIAVIFVAVFSAETMCVHRTATYPPKQLIKLVQPMHDQCVRATGTTEEAIRKFSEEPWSEIAPVDQNLKCYMHCFFRTLIEHEWSHEQLNSEISELDVDNWFTEEEIDALSNMDELCDTISLEEATGNDCEHAYTVVSCLKKANEEYFFLM